MTKKSKMLCCALNNVKQNIKKNGICSPNSLLVGLTFKIPKQHQEQQPIQYNNCHRFLSGL